MFNVRKQSTPQTITKNNKLTLLVTIGLKLLDSTTSCVNKITQIYDIDKLYLL